MPTAVKIERKHRIASKTDTRQTAHHPPGRTSTTLTLISDRGNPEARGHRPFCTHEQPAPYVVQGPRGTSPAGGARTAATAGTAAATSTAYDQKSEDCQAVRRRVPADRAGR